MTITVRVTQPDEYRTASDVVSAALPCCGTFF